ncbi:hypothetical protein BDR26DRAFT_888110 [Obelidium mucronatum]|nr:hypothetical protein BDR26DRAFT_888110 [Obelidium mucronatum]
MNFTLSPMQATALDHFTNPRHPLLKPLSHDQLNALEAILKTSDLDYLLTLSNSLNIGNANSAATCDAEQTEVASLQIERFDSFPSAQQSPVSSVSTPPFIPSEISWMEQLVLGGCRETKVRVFVSPSPSLDQRFTTRRHSTSFLAKRNARNRDVTMAGSSGFRASPYHVPQGKFLNGGVLINVSSPEQNVMNRLHQSCAFE